MTTDLETKPTETKLAPERPQLSAKHMLAITGAVAASVGGVVLLAAGGWIAVAGAAGATAVGAYGVHRIKHGPGKQSTIGQLLTRPRRPKTGGTLAWPFTGNQRGRALSRGSKSGSASQGRSRLPQLTTGSRARKAAASTGTRKSSGAGLRSSNSLPRHRPHRPVGASRKTTSAGGARPSSPKPNGGTRRIGKPSGIKRPGTPTRTPPKPSAASRLTTGSSGRRRAGGPGTTPGSSRRRSGGPSLTPRTSRKRSGVGSGGARSPWAGASRRPGKTSSPGHRPPSARPSTTSSRRPSATSRRTPKLLSGSPKTRTGSGTKRSSTPIRNPLRTTRRSGKLGGPSGSKRSTPPKRNGLRKAGRLGTPKFDLTPNPKAVPNRASKRQTARRAIPTNRKLVRDALRVPTANSKRTALKRPTKLQARKARRALGLRTAIATGKATTAIAKTPHRLAAAGGRAWWDSLQNRLPKTPDPLWLTPTVPDPKLKAQPGPKTTARPDGTPDRPLIPDAIIIPFPHDRREEQIKMSTRDAINDAMAQIAQFEPQSGMDIVRFLEEQGDNVSAMGEAFTTLADRMASEMPLAAPVVDAVRDLGAGLLSLVGIAQDAHGTMLAAHEADLQRIENPRPNEGLWNPDRNDS